MKAVIFDLDGVIVSTDEYHYQAWLRLAEEEGIPFDRDVNEKLRGVSRMESLDIILGGASRTYSMEDRAALAERKNRYYRELLEQLSPSHILPGVPAWLYALKSQGILSAIGSSSKNAKAILYKIGLLNAFDAIADGNDIVNSKPDPEVFLLAARRMGIPPSACLVVEDADAGIEAAAAAQMKSLAVGSAARHPKADLSAPDLASLDAKTVIHQLLF
ncbi:beta-phosphoglucomutase [Cohnella sp.]|uniref:beta-phosphoglucomutase n=1 Tax=Cohnella sp. TaxID=1883426 RepID=UPI0035625E5B